MSFETLHKLNLGSGGRPRDGYVNVDLYSDKADTKADCGKPLPFADGSAGEIRAVHVLEHLTVGRADVTDREAFYVEVLSDWRRVLAPGGILVAVIPDVCLWSHLYIYGHAQYSQLASALYGHDNTPPLAHGYGFTGWHLCTLMVRAGFANVKQVNKTDWARVVREMSTEQLRAHWGIAAGQPVSGHVEVRGVRQ